MPNSNFGNIQYKASNGLINLDEAQGIVECFVSGIGNKDSVGDICATGAFAKSLQRRKPRVVWGHNWNDPIGKVLEIYEVPASDQRLPMKMKMAGIGGLYAKVQFNLQSEKGKEAFANVAFFGEEQEWSIGYKTLRAHFDL
jgi:HK97 family phage prohead protease